MIAPGLLRNLILPAAEWFTRTRFWKCYQESLRFERWDTSRRTALQTQRLGEVWNAALGTELHRQRLQDAGLSATPVGPDDARSLLHRLPVVTKSALRRHFPAGVVTAGPAGDWRYLSTAGTTDRMTVISDFPKRDQRRSGELRALRLSLGGDVGIPTVEIPPNACNVVCGLVEDGPQTFLGYLLHVVRRGKVFTAEAQTELRGRFERQVLLRLHTLPPLEPMPASRLTLELTSYLEQITRLRPRLLRGLPLYLLWLADFSQDTGRPLPSLQAISPFGGLSSAAMIARMAGGLRCRFVNKYGTSELGTVAASCSRSCRGAAMHLFEDLFLVEVLRHGQPVPPGEVGRLVVTDLINTAMPLVRYDVGDVGRLHLEPCPCGRTTARLEVLGRVQEVLSTPTGPLTSNQVADVFFADPAVANFRLEEVASGSFEAALVARASGGNPEVGACQDRFAALYGGVRKLRIRVVPFVQPETSGKYRFVVPRPLKEEVL
jgi:phenylacetate-coenzyme A ligase PaaK-like adenylate-forming protein